MAVGFGTRLSPERLPGGVRSGGLFEWGTGSSVFGEGQGVRHEGEPEQVEPLAAVTDRVGSTEVEGVVEGPVDGLGVVALAEQGVEVRVGRRDGSDVLCPVQPAALVLVVAVEADGDLAAVGEPVVVVPAIEAALVERAVRADPGQRDEGGCCVVGWRGASARPRGGVVVRSPG